MRNIGLCKFVQFLQMVFLLFLLRFRLGLLLLKKTIRILFFLLGWILFWCFFLLPKLLEL